MKLFPIRRAAGKRALSAVTVFTGTLAMLIFAMLVSRGAGGGGCLLPTSMMEAEASQAMTGKAAGVPGKPTAGPGLAHPAWRSTYAEALAEASETGKPVLIDFMADWCPPCRKMEAEVWTDKEVQEVLRDRVIPLQLDADLPEARPVGVRYGIRLLPTLLLVDGSGEEIARANFMSAGELVEWIEAEIAE